MALPIRDGNQSLTTLSTILVSNSHIPAHTVVSFGSQGITDIATAVSGVELGPNTLNALENITVTLGQVTITGGLTDAQLRASAVTIGGIVTATISGTASVTFGTAVVTGSASILNFPATQTVTFGQATVTFGTAVITGSTSILNFPATQAVTFGTSVITGSTSIIGTASVTFGQAPVTFGTAVITGSTSIIGTPSVTFTQASVTFGESVITGSVYVLNLPATQTVTFSQAPVTFGTAVVTGSTSILNFPATQTVTFSQAPVTFGLISGTVTANPTGTQTIAGTVTANLGSSVTLSAVENNDIGAFWGEGGAGNPVYAVNTGWLDSDNLITGTSTQNPFPVQVVSAGAFRYFPSNTTTAVRVILGREDGAEWRENTDNVPIPVNIVQTGAYAVTSVTISGTVTIGSALPAGTNRIGVVTIGAGTVTIGAGTAQIGSVTASVTNPVTVGAIVGPLGGSVFKGSVSTDAIRALPYFSQNGAANYNELSTSNPFPIAGTVTVGNSVTIGSLPAISGTVTANLGDASNVIGGGYSSLYNLFASETVSVIQSGTVVVDSINDPISGTVTIGSALPAGTNRIGVVTIGNIQRAGDSVQSSLLTEAGSGYLLTKSTLNAGSEQIGSVTASISGTVPISISSVTIGNTVTASISGTVPVSGTFFQGTQPVSLTTLPALGAGTAQIGSVTASISNSVTISSLPAISGTVTANLSESITEPIDSTNATQAIAVHIKDADGNNWGAENIFPVVASGTVTANTFALQGTAVTTSNFTSTTASTVLANFNATREVLTIFNEGAGNLHICAGATCTTIAYQVRLSAGDYYEVPNHQTTITHSAVFATAGTARVTQVS